MPGEDAGGPGGIPGFLPVRILGGQRCIAAELVEANTSLPRPYTRSFIDCRNLLAGRHSKAYTWIIMAGDINLGRAKIADFLACPRRFQLRYLEQLSWPAAGRDPQVERAMELGQQFHDLLHRHFVGIPTGIPSGAGAQGDELLDPALRRWWRSFTQFEPRLPIGRREAELTLSVPLGRSMLSGRFDLLVDTGDRIHIFDWKTFGRVKNREQLRQDLQSRVYLALAAESGDILGRKINPEQITLTYWFFSDPPAEVSLNYSRRDHMENWQNFTAIADRIERHLAFTGAWPQTDDLSECARCQYQVPCSRIQPERRALEPEDDEWIDYFEGIRIEPDIP